MSLLLSLLIGCGTTDPPTAEPSEPSPERPPTIEDIPMAREIFLPKLLPFRSLQRMNVDQLRASDAANLRQPIGSQGTLICGLSTAAPLGCLIIWRASRRI